MTGAGLEKRPGGDSDAENARRAAEGQGRRRGIGAWPAKRETPPPLSVGWSWIGMSVRKVETP